MMQFKNQSILLVLTLLIHLTSLVHLAANLPDDARTQLGRHSDSVTSLAFSPNGRFLASAKPEPISRVRPDLARTQFSCSGKVYAVAFSPDGRLLASGLGDNTIQLWDTVAQRELAPLLGHEDWVDSVAFSPDGKLLASASADKTVRLWNVASQREIKRLKHSEWVQTVRFSSDGRLLASGSDDGKITAWTVDTTSRWFNVRTREIFTIEGHRGAVSSIAFSPDGDTLASGSYNYDGTVKLWSIRDKREISTLPGHSQPVYSVAFSPDGKTLASGSGDNSVKLWAVATGQEVATLEHTGYVESVAFSPDGTLLASGLTSVEDNVILWDVSSGTKLAALAGHTNSVTSVAFSRDGKRLATGSRDSTVFIWELSHFVPVPPPPDLVSPKIVILHPPSARFTVKTDVQKIIVSGKATDSSGIGEVHVNEIQARVLETGAFKKEVSLNLGPNTIRVVAADRHGNQTTEVLTVIRGGDTTPPVIVIEPPIPSTTTAEMLSISGRATDASGVSTVTVNYEPVRVLETGAFKKEVHLNFGKNRISITATDPGGNSQTVEVTVIREDDIPPTIVINAPPNSPFTVAPDVAQTIVTGIVTDASGIPEVTVNDEPVRVLETGAFKKEVHLNFGKNRISITATDPGGNSQTVEVTVIREDDIPPTIVINAPPNSPFTVEDDENKIIIAGVVTSASGLPEVRVNLEPVRVLETGAFKAEVLLNYGENPITITAIDRWGTQSTKKVVLIRREPLDIDIRPPEIFIDSPAVRGFQQRIYVTEKMMTLSGRAVDASGIAEVRIDGEQVPVSATGQFEKAIALVFGENRIRITATDTLGNRAAKNLHVRYDEYVRQGKDYALLFAANSYEHWQNLLNPIPDAMKIKRELEETYGFEVELIHNPTMQEVFAALREYAVKTYDDEDQVMIFFAGHGHFDEIFQIGYLVARDSELPENDREHIGYISHPLLKERIDNIACKHIFLMIDACFSGTLDPGLLVHRGEKSSVNIERVMKYTTRRYMTSGGKEYVPDKSEFASWVLEALRSKGGEDGILTLDEFFNYVKQANPQPRQGTFGYRNEPGSDFLFIAK